MGGGPPSLASPTYRISAKIFDASRILDSRKTKGAGLLPEHIEAVSSRYALEGNPPLLEDVPEWIDILVAKQCRSKARTKGDTAMAVAFNKAKDRAA